MPITSLASNAGNLVLARSIRKQVAVCGVGAITNSFDGMELVDVAVASAGWLITLDVVLIGASGVAVVSHTLAVGNAGETAANSSLVKSVVESQVDHLVSIECELWEGQIVKGLIVEWLYCGGNSAT